MTKGPTRLRARNFWAVDKYCSTQDPMEHVGTFYFSARKSVPRTRMRYTAEQFEADALHNRRVLRSQKWTPILLMHRVRWVEQGTVRYDRYVFRVRARGESGPYMLYVFETLQLVFKLRGRDALREFQGILLEKQA